MPFLCLDQDFIEKQSLFFHILYFTILHACANRHLLLTQSCGITVRTCHNTDQVKVSYSLQQCPVIVSNDCEMTQTLSELVANSYVNILSHLIKKCKIFRESRRMFTPLTKLTLLVFLWIIDVFNINYLSVYTFILDLNFPSLL